MSKGSFCSWQWANSCEFVRFFSDGERRYAQELWNLASVRLKYQEVSAQYGHLKVWREGLEVAIKIKGSQGRPRVEWVKPEHPFTAISLTSEVHANQAGGSQQFNSTTLSVLTAVVKIIMRKPLRGYSERLRYNS